MNPAWSVILLTTLSGAGQGLFLALYVAELAALVGVAVAPDERLFVLGSAVCVSSLERVSSPRSFILAGRLAPGARQRSGARRGFRGK